VEVTLRDPGDAEEPEEFDDAEGEEIESEGDNLDWAGLDAEVAQVGYVAESTTRNLVGYFRDCAVANQRGLKLLNIFGESDAQVLGVPANAWDDAVADGLVVEGRDALNLAMANEISPFDKPLMLGALFVVGRLAGRAGRPKTICAPLLVGSISQTREATGATFVLEGDVGVNLSLLADLIGVDRDNEEEVQLRFETLMDLVPDAPLTDNDVAAFCTGLEHQLELPFEVPAFESFAESDLAAELAEGGELRLLPVSAVFIGKEAAELSVIRELDAVGQSDPEESALVALLEPETLAARDVAGVGEAGAGTAHVRPVDWHDDIEVLELTDTQRRIVASARVEPLTVVTGPPGTGKSYTIAAIALDHLLAGKTVLVSSGTEKAVDVVADRLALLGGPYVVAVSGNRTSQRTLAEHIDKVTSPAGAPNWYPPAQVDAERNAYLGLRGELQALEARLEETLAREGALAFHLQATEEGAELLGRYRVEGAHLEYIDELREKIRIEPMPGGGAGAERARLWSTSAPSSMRPGHPSRSLRALSTSPITALRSPTSRRPSRPTPTCVGVGSSWLPSG
jgi:hypothetical protein